MPPCYRDRCPSVQASASMNFVNPSRRDRRSTTRRKFHLTMLDIRHKFRFMRLKWPKVTPSDEWLLANGWKKKRTYSGSTRYIFISPCCQFVCKMGFFTTSRPRRYAIPCKFLEANRGYGYTFVLQP